MSSKAMAWAWNVDGIKSSEKLVLLRLADHANDQGLCWPGKDSLADVCGMTRRTVDAAILKLEQSKLISITRRSTDAGRNRSNVYQLHLNQGELFNPAETTSPQNLRDSNICQVTPQNLREDPAKSAPEPTIEPKTEPKELSSSGDEVRKNPDVYESKKGKRLTGVVLELFDRFWNAFDYKQGRAEAADTWLEVVQPRLKAGTLNLEHLLAAARHEATERPRLKESGGIPKMAQGWLAARRWEDFNAPPKRPDVADLPWYQTRVGVEEEAYKRGIFMGNAGGCEHFHEVMTALISDMERNLETVPAGLIAYRDHVKRAA
jgi:DNA-binding MarR family transcriptional regulator